MKTQIMKRKNQIRKKHKDEIKDVQNKNKNKNAR